MKNIYFTITGTKYRCGHDFMKPGMKVKLVKEPDNAYDAEAIKVMMKGVGLVGYVANSVYTVKGESWSAGRIVSAVEYVAPPSRQSALPILTSIVPK